MKDVSIPQLSPVFWGLFPVVVFFILGFVIGVMDECNNTKLLVVIEEESWKFNSAW